MQPAVFYLKKFCNRFQKKEKQDEYFKETAGNMGMISGRIYRFILKYGDICCKPEKAENGCRFSA